MKTDITFEDIIQLKAGYITAFKFTSVHEIVVGNETYKQTKSKLKEVSKISRASKHILTPFNLECDTFAEAIKQEEDTFYKTNECVINAFVAHYKTTLMGTNKRVAMTSESLITDMGNTEAEHILNGATFEELEPIFEKYRIQYRVYDVYN